MRWGVKYPCDDPENGPARAYPIEGCVLCGETEADWYVVDDVNPNYGMCCMCDYATVHNLVESSDAHSTEQP